MPAVGPPIHFERHSQEQITPYRLVLQHAPGFVAQTDASTGTELLRLNKDEFDATLSAAYRPTAF